MHDSHQSFHAGHDLLPGPQESTVSVQTQKPSNCIVSTATQKAYLPTCQPNTSQPPPSIFTRAESHLQSTDALRSTPPWPFPQPPIFRTPLSVSLCVRLLVLHHPMLVPHLARSGQGPPRVGPMVVIFTDSLQEQVCIGF